MKKYTLLADLKLAGSSKNNDWLTVAPLERKLTRQINRMFREVSKNLPEHCVVVHRTVRLSNPPRKYGIEMFHIQQSYDNLTFQEIDLAQGQISDWEALCSTLTLVSAELASRWPEGIRPEALALMCDGKSLWFNPGRPSGLECAWLTDHLSGESPCALIQTKSKTKPFEPDWFDYL